jgi:uncharacterized membrane protein
VPAWGLRKILRLSATDVDEGGNQGTTYSLSSEKLPTDIDFFCWDEKTGEAVHPAPRRAHRQVLRDAAAAHPQHRRERQETRHQDPQGQMFGVDTDKMTKRWSKERTEDNKRSVCMYILDTIKVVFDAIMNFGRSGRRS